MDIVLKTKSSDVFVFLKSQNYSYLSEIAKETGTTYVYITKLVSELEKMELVSVEPQSKKKIVKLTDKGREVATYIEEIRRRCE